VKTAKLMAAEVSLLTKPYLIHLFWYELCGNCHPRNQIKYAWK